ncbi:hypothetical protein MVES1_003011 [Malassezia vespertilionis]|nr:uncharacterized protein MVES1_003011 [Malassezia vespertilionis]WFD07642.1 hypothetical protein MVES1_003011 [Malassezia vespertilionis]
MGIAIAVVLVCSSAVQADLLRTGEYPQPGYPFGKHCNFNEEQEADIKKDALNHFKVPEKGYCFEAFPNSRVPTSSCFVIIVAFGITVCFFLLSCFLNRFYCTLFRNTANTRKEAWSNLRVVGVLMEKSEPALPVDPENVVPLAPESDSDLSETRQKLINLRPATEGEPTNYGSGNIPSHEKEEIGAAPIISTQDGSGTKKGKEVYSSGAIVPVLRNEDPAVMSDDQSDDDFEDDDNFGNYRRTRPQRLSKTSSKDTNRLSVSDLGPSPSYSSDLPAAAPAIQPSDVMGGNAHLSASSSSNTAFSIRMGARQDSNSSSRSSDLEPGGAKVPDYVL